MKRLIVVLGPRRGRSWRFVFRGRGLKGAV